MNKRERQQVDAIRRRSNEIQNLVIDEYEDGKLNRREFLRKGSIVGLSIPFVGLIAAACGSGGDAATTTTTAAATTTTAGVGATTTLAPAPAGPTTVRVGIAPAPTNGVEPVIINDRGGLSLLGQTGQYLNFSDSELNLRPVLAESWEPNATLDVWTFNLNPIATFNDGSPVTAADVVATFNGPIGDGNAGSAYETFGVAVGAAAVAIDDRTVEFNLTRPNGAFPFFVSSDNYNAVILPASFWETYEAGSYETGAQKFIGSGEWINESYDPGVSAVYVKNPNYWGDNSGQPDVMEVAMFGDEAAMVTAFQDGRLDVLGEVSFSTAQTLEAGGANVVNVPTSQHRQIYMDTTQPPFGDKRVRQAMALMIDRPLFVEGLLGGFGVVGNDHPIWPFYSMYNDGAVPQREQNLSEAQSLLDAAGLGGGFSAPLDTGEFAEMPLLGQLLKTSARELNVDLSVNVVDLNTYYQDFWCSFPYEGTCSPGGVASMGIVNYGHRGVPNVYLGAPLLSDGQWNASHWIGANYDQLVADFSAAADVDTQKSLAGQIQSLLWEEVPFIVPYFIDTIAVTVADFTGLETTGMGHFDLINSGFTG